MQGTSPLGKSFLEKDCQIPKQLLYCQRIGGERKAGRQQKRYKDTLKAYQKDINIDVTTWKMLPLTDQPGKA